MTYRWIIGLTLAAAMVIPCMAQGRGRGGDASGAYKRLDQGKLAEALQTKNMKEFVEALGEQAEQSTSVADLYVAAQCKSSIAMGELLDLEKRERLLNEAIELTRKCVEATADPKTDAEWVNYFVYRTALARLLANDRCALGGDKVMMLIGGDEDRKLLEKYTREVILPGKDKNGNDSKPMVNELLDKMQMKLEDWTQSKDSTAFMLHSPKVERAQAELKYYSAWMYFYRGLSLDAKDKQKAAMLEQAISAATPFTQADDNLEPAMLLLVGVARSELGVLTKDDGQFVKSQAAFDQALAIETLPRAMKVNVQFQLCCNLVRWGKFEDAFKKIDSFPLYMTALMGKSALMTGDMREALLKNFLFDNWAKASTDKTKIAEYNLKGQQALVDFIIKYASNKEAVGDFLKILAEKYRGETDFAKLPPLIQFATGRDHFDKYALLYQNKGDAKLMDEERKKALTALTLVTNSSAPEVKDLVPQALDMLVAMGGDWAKVADQAIKSGSKETLINAAVALRDHIDKQDVGDIGAVRLKMVEVIEILTSNKEFVKDVKLVQPWFYDLGDQYRMLARRPSADEMMIDFQTNGIAAYSKVPATDLRTSMGARFMGLLLEYDRLMALNEPSMKAVAEKRKFIVGVMADDLVRANDQFVEDVKNQSKADAGLAKELQTWAGMTKFHSAVVMWEISKKGDKAKAILVAVRKDFKGTPSVMDSWVFQIGKAVKENQTGEAIDGIKQIEKDAPEQATALMSNVISQIQTNLAKMQSDPTTDPAKLTALRKTYMDFAKSLLEKANDTSKKTYEQLYADALLANGKVDEAMELFTRLYDDEKKFSQAKEQEIDKLIDARLESMKGMSNSDLMAMGKGFDKILKEFKVSDTRKAKADIDAAITNIEKAPANDTEESVKFMYDTLSGRIKKGLEGIRRDLKEQVPMSQINIQGLARCYRGQKKYDDAIKYYTILLGGLSRAQYPAEYWRAQLEQTQTKFESANSLSGQDRTKALEYLLQWVKSYRDSGQDMGSIRGEFITLEDSIKEAIGQKK